MMTKTGLLELAIGAMVRVVNSETVMANLYINEYSDILPLPMLPSKITAKQKVAFTTAAQSAAFAAGTRMIRVLGDAAFHLAFGANPTATAAFARYESGIEYVMSVAPGEKLSVYDGSS